ncbi:YceI family protein [Algoriphagus boritolerans]|uniref:Polyisoprenoid-binding protein YceI n=1 Tax=Algoriphagus boritolerans DSM 17298 = JCM 18970 TaxID=1120964 RepID=A0A1H5UUE4_9BACT|nr:YceI family protein [Algoriphagus boritolerans]SEF78685.1 Polyisoprenoid-binding protein YceI [Algoriphagus boritolerans DSM 17298 = JCM 18970]
MKLIAALILAYGTFFTANENFAPATVNKTESQVTWKAAKVTGEHWGYVPIKNASLDVNGGKITGGSFDMDMVNLTVEDLTDEKSKGNLTNHLKSDDFFSVEKFNTSTFKITDVKATNATDYTITGDLTIKGITKPVTFPAKVAVAGNKMTATGTIKFDRTHYDIKFRSGNFFENLGDRMIYDEVNLDVKLVAII